MKIIMFAIILFLFQTNLFPQEQTFINPPDEKGFFGGPVVKFTSLRDQAALIIGGRGGWIFGHSFNIGAGLYGSLTEVDAVENALPQEGPLDVQLGYGGLEVEYVFNSNKLIHLNSYILIGAGTVRYVKDVGSIFESNEQSGETDLVFALEPALNAEMNVAPWVRVDVGLSYRLITGVNQPGLEGTDLNGITGLLTVKFGKF